MPWEKLLALVEPYLAPGGFTIFLALSSLPVSLPKGWTTAAQEAVHRCRRLPSFLGPAKRLIPHSQPAYLVLEHRMLGWNRRYLFLTAPFFFR